MNYCMEDDVNRIINNGKKSFIDRIEKDTRYGSKAIIFNTANSSCFCITRLPIFWKSEVVSQIWRKNMEQSK